MCSKRDLYGVPQQHGKIVQGLITLVRWQVDCKAPVSLSEGYQHSMDCVVAAAGLLLALPTCCKDQQTNKRGLVRLLETCVQLQVTECAEGTNFTGHGLKGWLQ